MYTANGPSNDISVLDVENRQVTKKIPVDMGPWNRRREAVREAMNKGRERADIEY